MILYISVFLQLCTFFFFEKFCVGNGGGINDIFKSQIFRKEIYNMHLENKLGEFSIFHAVFKHFRIKFAIS